LKGRGGGRGLAGQGGEKKGKEKETSNQWPSEGQKTDTKKKRGIPAISKGASLKGVRGVKGKREVTGRKEGERVTWVRMTARGVEQSTNR